MVTEQDKKRMCDAVIVCAGYTGVDNVVLHTATKEDAEWIYSAVSDISETRNIDKTSERGLHREYYLDLAESDEHQIDGAFDELSWNTRPLYRVSFIPDKFCHQRMLNWANENQSLKAPRDFKLSKTVAEFIYRAGAFEMQGADGEPYIEFTAENSQKLEAELQNLDISSVHVNNLWRLDVESSKTFREYAEIKNPRGGD